jgi:hypothetical protein
MHSDYDAITKRNVTELGTKTSTRKTQICMYSDLTHFVYELLQNADDQKATEVFFRLTPSQVVIEHNGTPFAPRDVIAITSFGESTSRDDMLKTGRFGVGFKSVFAFTATPIIVSGEERFRIHGLYRVEEQPYPEGLPEGRTRIILPFNHETEKPDYVDDLMSAQEAFTRISERMLGLNRSTLLFMSNIREIRWEINDKSGHYLREDTRTLLARRTTITDGEALNTYLVFSRTPTWRGKTFKEVEIAFSLDEKNQITTVKDYLYVLFCTTQETHLQFILNGPYKTNPSRETISEEDTFNRHLMKETCELLALLLPQLREDGLLTTQFLGVLPNPDDELRPFYAPILNTVVECFQTESLVPTSEAGYATAQRSFQGPSALREVVSCNDLAFLEQVESASWAKGVGQNTRPDQFLKSLNIRQWGYSELQKRLRAKFSDSTYTKSAADAFWLEQRSDEWLQKLYILLGEALSRGECDRWVLQRCAVIRVIVNNTVSHVNGAQAYFPKSKGYRDLPQIKPAVLRGRSQQISKRIEDGLIALGVREIGEEERIDLVLTTYYCHDKPEVDPKQHLEHMRLFIKWWKSKNSVGKFAQRSVFCVVGSKGFELGSSCYLDTPLKSTGLHTIFKVPRHGVPRRFKVSPRYRHLKEEGFCDFAIACGVRSTLSIERQSCQHHPNKIELFKDYNKYGVKFTSTAIDQDFFIPGIDALLRLRSVEINQLIWDTLRKANPDVLVARFRPNRQYDVQSGKSSIALALARATWVPDSSGKLHKAADIEREILHPSFQYDDRNGWLTAIGFAEGAKKATAEYQRRQESVRALGLSMEIVDLIVETPLEAQAELTALLKNWTQRKERAASKLQETVPFYQALETFFRTPQSKASSEKLFQSEGFSRNPVRRREQLAGVVSEDIDNEPSQDARFTFGLRKRWKGKNDAVRQKLIEWYGGKCQICKKTFAQHDGEPYFEGLYLVPYTKAEWIDRPGNVLSLCPCHSAMFQFGSKHVDTDVAERVLGFVPRASGGSTQASIDLTLCGHAERIDFHEDHFIELGVMIQESRRGESG